MIYKKLLLQNKQRGLVTIESAGYFALSLFLLSVLLGLLSYFAENRDFKHLVNQGIQYHFVYGVMPEEQGLARNIQVANSQVIEFRSLSIINKEINEVRKDIYGEESLLDDFNFAKVQTVIAEQPDGISRFLKNRSKKYEVFSVRAINRNRKGMQGLLVSLGLLPKEQYLERIIIL